MTAPTESAKPPCCVRWDGGATPCPFHGGKWNIMSAGTCPDCGHRNLALTRGGTIPPHKPAGRESWRDGYGAFKDRAMVSRFEFNKCPGGGKIPTWVAEFRREFGPTSPQEGP